MERVEDAKRAILLALEATLYVAPRAPGLSREELNAVGAGWEPRLGAGSIADALLAHEESGAVGDNGPRYLLGRRRADRDLSELFPRWHADPRDPDAFQAVADAIDDRADERGSARAKFNRDALAESAFQRYPGHEHDVEVAITVLLFEQRLDYDVPTAALVTLFSPGVDFKADLSEQTRREISTAYFLAATGEDASATALLGWSAERAREWPRPRQQAATPAATVAPHNRSGFERALQIVGQLVSTRPPFRPQSAPANGTPVLLKELSLQDFRCFSSSVVPFSGGGGLGCQWVVLLGQNGVGKSTILRAIALALNPRVPGGLRGDSPFVRAGGRGLAAVVLNTDHGRFDTTIAATAAGERVFAEPSQGQAPPVFGYGCQRGSAIGGPDRDVPLDEQYSCVTLFDDTASLIHADSWLRRVALRAAEGDDSDKELFDTIKRTLVGLLPGVQSIDVGPDRTVVTGPDVGSVPLAALSDGYLSMLGWTIDLMARYVERERRAGRRVRPHFLREMRAIVLVDEIDLHLHPSWQTKVVGLLRATFPQATFVVTTHNPLTLHGAQPGEVFVLTRRDGGAIEIAQRDVPPGLSADQLLTGDWFGLESARDRETVDKLKRHRALLANGVPETDAERSKLEHELRRRLGQFGDTAIERVAQTVVAEFLAGSNDRVTSEQRKQMAEKLRERLRGPVKTGT